MIPATPERSGGCWGLMPNSALREPFGDPRAARGPAELLQRLLRAGLSRYEPDPLQAIAESSDGENDTKPSDAKRISRPTLTGLYRFQFFSRADQQLLALPIPNNHVLGRKCDYLPFLFVVPHISFSSYRISSNCNTLLGEPTRGLLSRSISPNAPVLRDEAELHVASFAK